MAYPGTPSTETLETFAKKDGVYAEWCINEKVAVEVGVGASAAGARVLATMKHVGVNVAADPLFTGPEPGPPPPCGAAKVLCKFKCIISTPKSAGLAKPIKALKFAPSI